MEIISREFSSRVTARYSGWPVSSIEPPSVISKRISQRRFGALELVFASRSLWLSIEKSRSSIYEIMCMAAKWAVNVPIRIEPILIKLNRSLPNLDKDRQDIAHLAHMVQKGKAILELQYEKGKGISQVYLFRQSQSRPSCGFIKIPWMCTRLWPVPMTQRLQTDGDAGTSSSLRLVSSSQSRVQPSPIEPKADALALSSLHLAGIIPGLSVSGLPVGARLKEAALLMNYRYQENGDLLRQNLQRPVTGNSPNILWDHKRKPVIKTVIKATRDVSTAIEDGVQNFAVSKGEAFANSPDSRSSNMIFLENGAVYRYQENGDLLRQNLQMPVTGNSPNILWDHKRKPVIKTVIKATRDVSTAIEDGVQNFAVSKGEAFVNSPDSRSSNMIFLENGAVNKGGTYAGRAQNQARLAISHSITEELSRPVFQLTKKNLMIEGGLKEPDPGLKTSDLDSLNLNRISDRVCAIIERKLKVERERRGIFG